MVRRPCLSSVRPFEPGWPYSDEVGRVVAAALAEHAQPRFIGIPVDPVRVGVAEEQVAAIAHPHRTFGETEAFGELPQLGVHRDDFVQRRIDALDAHIDFVRRHGHRTWRAALERELRFVEVDVVGRRVGDRAVHAEHGHLNLLARPCVVREYDTIRCAPARHHGAAHLAVAAADFAVHPDLGVVIEPRLEPDSLAGDAHAADRLGERQRQAIPVE